MVVEYPRHPGASTVGSELIDEIAPMAGKLLQLSHEPSLRREEGLRLHRLTNATSKHALVQVHEQTQQNAREPRPLTNALAQVPHKTLLGTREC